MSEPFGFTVRQEVDYQWVPPALRYKDRPKIVTRYDGWDVCLYRPQQSEVWQIIEYWPREGSNHEKAVAELERFIAEAQAALTALRERREFPTKETP